MENEKDEIEVGSEVFLLKKLNLDSTDAVYGSILHEGWSIYPKKYVEFCLTEPNETWGLFSKDGRLASKLDIFK